MRFQQNPSRRSTPQHDLAMRSRWRRKMAMSGRLREQRRPSRPARAWRGMAGPTHSRSMRGQRGQPDDCPVRGAAGASSERRGWTARRVGRGASDARWVTRQQRGGRTAGEVWQSEAEWPRGVRMGQTPVACHYRLRRCARRQRGACGDFVKLKICRSNLVLRRCS